MAETKPPVDQAAVDEARRQYPQYSWAFDHPDIGPLLTQAVAEGWPDGRLTGEIQKTNWWKHTEPARRQYQETFANDPAKIEQQMKQILPDIWDSWASLGMDVNMGDQFFSDIARQSIQYGWSEGQLKDALISRVKFNYTPGKATPVGSVGTAMNSLKQKAGQYYLQMDDMTAFNYARQIAAGEHKEEDYDVMFREQAKGRFPTLQKFIDQGITPQNYFQPYQQTIAQLLERNPTDIDFANDPRWSKVIDTVDDKGERRPMTLSETQTYVRGLDDWKSTRQGQEAAATAAEGILKIFGKTA